MRVLYTGHVSNTDVVHILVGDLTNESDTPNRRQTRTEEPSQTFVSSNLCSIVMRILYHGYVRRTGVSKTCVMHILEGDLTNESDTPNRTTNRNRATLASY